MLSSRMEFGKGTLSALNETANFTMRSVIYNLFNFATAISGGVYIADGKATNEIILLFFKHILYSNKLDSKT